MILTKENIAATFAIIFNWMVTHFEILTGFVFFLVMMFFYVREKMRKERILDEELKQAVLDTEKKQEE